MKILFFTTYYLPFLKHYFSNRAANEEETYSQMLEALLGMYFADTGSAYYYSGLKGCEPFITIANCEPLQKKWAKENNISFTEGNWQKEIAFAQVKKFNPDVLFIESVYEYYGEFLNSVKQYCRKIIAWISTPYNNKLNLNNISLILTSTKKFIEKFEKEGVPADYMLPAFDTRILNLINANRKDIPFSFIGGWTEIHLNRMKALRYLVEKTDIQIWGYGFKPKTFSKKSFKFYKNIFFPEPDLIIERYNGEAWGKDMYHILSKSLITFNIHESLLDGQVGNMRMFEATGVGTLLLNDIGTNLSDIFIPGKEIETYSSLEEAVEKSNYYKNHPKEAIEIGNNAQKRTINQYNYFNYLEMLLHFFNRNL